MEEVVRNVFLFDDKSGAKRFFGEVVESNRFKKGHCILSSDVTFIDGKIIKTINSKYSVENFLSEKEFINHINNSYDTEKVNYCISYINFIKGDFENE